MVEMTQEKIFKSFFRVDLRRLILWLCVFFVILALGNSLYAAHKVQHGLLLRHSFDTHRAYAEKLAHVTDSFLESSARVIQAAALDVSQSQLDPAAIQQELDQLASVTDAFDAIIVVDKSGKVTAAKLDTDLLNFVLEAPQARQLLNAHG